MMSSNALQTLPESPTVGGSLTPWQNVGDLLLDPIRVFQSIRSGSRSWWRPLVILYVGIYLLFGAITYKVGWRQVTEDTYRQRPAIQDQMSLLPQDKQERMLQTQSMAAEIAFGCSPLLLFIECLLIAAVLLGIFKLVYGNGASFVAIFAVVVFSMLPTVMQPVLASALLMTNVTTESFHITTMYPTSLASFLPSEVNRAVLSLASSFDVFSLWSVILVGLGMSVITGTPRKTAVVTVLLLWAVAILIRSGATLMLG
jgi:membrane protein insertase Oxa1/YidC/SpoIIIJ